MNESLDRLLNLAQKTNSRLIVYDRTAGKHLVVMGIDDFESLTTGQVPVKIVDDDADRDHELIQKLNQEIAEWRNRAQNQEVENTVADFSEEEDLEENLEEPIQTVVKEIPKSSDPSIKSLPSSPPSSWHKFGDVMARYQPAPKMPEVRYEPAEALESEKTQALDDEPIFLEEPVE